MSDELFNEKNEDLLSEKTSNLMRPNEYMEPQRMQEESSLSYINPALYAPEYLAEQKDVIFSKLEQNQAVHGVKRFEGWADEQETLKNYRIILLKNDQKWYDSDSPEMTDVKTKLNLITDAVEEPIPKEGGIDFIMDKYRDAIEACEHYVATKHPLFSSGKKRLAKVKDVLNQLLEERERIVYGLELVKQKKENNETVNITCIKDLLSLEKENYKQPLNVEAENKMKEDILDLYQDMYEMRHDKEDFSDEEAANLYRDLYESGMHMTLRWSNMTDRERGQAMAKVFFTSGKFLSDKRYGNSSRNKIAKDFRIFIASALTTMDKNCRSHALEQIFAEENRLKESGFITPELDALNNTLFADISKQRFQKSYNDNIENMIRKGELSREDAEPLSKESLDQITDVNFRSEYVSDRIASQREALHVMHKEEEYGSLYERANKAYTISRFNHLSILTEPIRIDRYGKIIKEDESKKEGYKNLYTKIANANEETVKEMVEKLIKRVFKVDFRKHLDKEYLKTHLYEAYNDNMLLLEMQNFMGNWNGSLKKTGQDMLKKTDLFAPLNDLAAMSLGLVGYYNAYFNYHGMYFNKMLMGEELTNGDLLHELAAINGLKKDSDIYNGENKSNLFFYEKDKKMPSGFGTAPNNVDIAKSMIKHYDEAEEGDYVSSFEYYNRYVDNKLREYEEHYGPDEKKMEESYDAYMNYIEKMDSIFDKEEAYKKAVELCKDNSIIEELKAVEKDYPDYRENMEKSLKKRIEIDMHAVGYSYDKKDVEKYYEELKALSKVTNEIESRQYDIILKKSGEETADNWLAGLDLAHAQMEEERKRLLNRDEMTAKDCLVYDGEESFGNYKAFVRDEWGSKKGIYEAIQKNFPNFTRQDFARLLYNFVRPVKMDLTGRFLSSEDRANHQFNEHLKEVLTGDYKTEEEKENAKKELEKIGADHIEYLLKLPEPLDPDTPEEELLRNSDYFEMIRDHQLNTFSVIIRKTSEENELKKIFNVESLDNIPKEERQKAKEKILPYQNNECIPELGKALFDLQKTDPAKFAKLEKSINVKSGNAIDCLYTSNHYGYKVKRLGVSEEEATAQKALYDNHYKKEWSQTYNEWKEGQNSR